MVSEDLWRGIVKNLDDKATADKAVAALRSLLQRLGEEALPHVAYLAQLVGTLQTPRGKELGLSVLSPYASGESEVLDLAINMSEDTAAPIRKAAASMLVRTSTSKVARDRVFELVNDPEAEIRNIALTAISEMEVEGTTPSGEAVWHVIPKGEQREEALKLLDELERAVKMLQELNPGEVRDAIIDKIILPMIGELRELFQAEFTDQQQVIAQRHHGLRGIGALGGAAQALAIGTSALANADEAAKNAAQTVTTAADGLSSAFEILQHLI